MKSKIQHLIIFIGTILAFPACSDSLDLPEETYESIAIIYWMGDNGLSGYAQDDIDELVKGKDNIPANSKIIIYTDQQNALPVIYQLDAENGLEVWKKLTREEDCTDSLTILTNLRSIVNAFPAKKYGLSFGAHGSGMIWNQRRALGPDYSHNTNWLNIPTLRGILEHLPHMSYIFFDVCFMQGIEVAYELRNQADWIIGSPAEIPNPGAPFNLLGKALCEGDVSSIVSKYESVYPTGKFKGTVLSVVKCNELEALAAQTKVYIKQWFSGRQTITQRQAEEIQKYSSDFSFFTYCYDMNSAMSKILSEEDYNSWVKTFDKAVPLRGFNTGQWTASHCNNSTIYDPDHFGGISMYIPQEGAEGDIKNNDLKHYQWYKDAGWNETGW